MTQLVLNIESPSVARAIKALVKNIAGVEIAGPNPKKRKTGFELAMEDVKEGRLIEYSSVKEMIAAAKKMKYTLKTTKQYAKQLKKCLKRGCDESSCYYGNMMMTT